MLSAQLGVGGALRPNKMITSEKMNSEVNSRGIKLFARMCHLLDGRWVIAAVQATMPQKRVSIKTRNPSYSYYGPE
jgi:hypothetical protein